MHRSTILLTTAAVLQGALATGVATYEGPDCTGARYNVYLANQDRKEYIPAFRSYRENGWGTNLFRIGFYESTDCETNRLYDTWAYNGDYFQSGKCYNVKNHAAELGSPYEVGRCIRGYLAGQE